jgi:tRNA-2-methylthio-N6-dimethylallyladenosine synthase
MECDLTSKSEQESKPKERVYIRTFGCQMNEYDSLKLAKILEPSHTQVSRPEEADLVLINTCSVRDKPEHKLYSLLGEIREIKTTNPKLMIGVGGCVAQQEGDSIISKSRDVGFVFGTHNLSLVPSLIDRFKETKEPQVAINYRDEWEEMPLGFTDQPRTVAFVSISRGCNKNCTYCIVPRTRGPEVSRRPEEILREIKILAHKGAREVVLLGQTVNSYGLDFSPRGSFVGLLKEVAAIEEIKRIRFTSPHPQEIRQDFIDLVCSEPKVCRHVHMPLQSGSDVILKAMNRNYRRKKYLSIIQALKERVPDMAITTDIIVGFPGETREDFEQTLDIMRQVEFDSSYSFAFSPRPGTEAAAMVDDVPHEEKLNRLYELQALQIELTNKKLQSWVGQEVELLIDGATAIDASLLRGRSSQNIVVNMGLPLQGVTVGDFVKVKIVHASKNTLRAEPLINAKN